MKKLGLIVFVKSQASVQPCINILGIISEISIDHRFIVVADEKLDISSIKSSYPCHIYISSNENSNIFITILNHIKSQLNISYCILKLYNVTDTWIFFMGDTYVIPLFLIKLIRKKSMLCLASSLENDVKLRLPPLSKFIIFNGKMGLKLSDYIIVYSRRLIDEWNLNKYSNKILVGSRHYVDFNKFKVITEYSNRNTIIGYIGRFSPEKGIMNFIKAANMLKKDNLEFLLIGDGNLKNDIDEYIHKNTLNNHLKCLGWIPHDTLPYYLNSLKLLVLPSYTEGIPNVILEAMACGTPVLATSVGAISDVISDGETGFLMENNSPECIARNVVRALEYPHLDCLVKNAKKFVECEFTYKAAVERYNQIFNKI